MSLFSLVFALTLFSIYNAAYNQAERQFIARLNVGQNVFVNEIANAKQQLDLSVDTVAKDWALRSAIGGGESGETILSVLFNFASRIEADVAIVLDTQYQLIAQYGSDDEQIKAIATQFDESQSLKPWIVMINAEPYLVSAEVVRAPGPIGWLLMGKPLDLALLDRIKSLISLDINLIAVQNEQGSIVLSTQDNDANLAAQLVNLATSVGANNQPSLLALRSYDVATKPFSLFENERQSFMVVLQGSTQGWMQALQPFMFEILPFFIIGLILSVIGSYYIARTITRLSLIHI